MKLGAPLVIIPVVFAAAGLIAGLLSSCATSPEGRRQLIVVPDSQMNTMGAQAFDQMKGQVPVSSDSRYNAFANCVALPITEAAKGQLDVQNWEVVVFKDDSANAFALPGGKIGVHTGILPVAKTDAQLAAVLGHEVGHVIARHGAERVSEQAIAAGGLAALGSVTGGDTQGQLLMAALGMGAQFGVVLPHGRTQESEADIIGLRLMARAGFDPRQSVELWKNMNAAAGGKAPPEWLSTHPSGSTRIDNLNSHMAEAMAEYEKAQAAGHRPSCPHP